MEKPKGEPNNRPFMRSWGNSRKSAELRQELDQLMKHVKNVAAQRAEEQKQFATKVKQLNESYNQYTSTK